MLERVELLGEVVLELGAVLPLEGPQAVDLAGEGGPVLLQPAQQLFSALERDRTSLATEVESLRTFEREYRTELKDYFAKQLDALEHPLAHSERFGTGADATPVEHRTGEPTDEHTGGPVGS